MTVHYLIILYASLYWDNDSRWITLMIYIGSYMRDTLPWYKSLGGSMACQHQSRVNICGERRLQRWRTSWGHFSGCSDASPGRVPHSRVYIDVWSVLLNTHCFVVGTSDREKSERSSSSSSSSRRRGRMQAEEYNRRGNNIYICSALCVLLCFWC